MRTFKLKLLGRFYRICPIKYKIKTFKVFLISFYTHKMWAVFKRYIKQLYTWQLLYHINEVLVGINNSDL